ncbi:MAG: hypothetical protein JW950_05605, partial [Deltaproteobacteria bacterium]|nr:hypothetical protein [Deltaproteobacteria bacterium]
KKSDLTHFCHSRESGNPVNSIYSGPPLSPAFAGAGCKGVIWLVTFYETINNDEIVKNLDAPWGTTKHENKQGHSRESGNPGFIFVPTHFRTNS